MKKATAVCLCLTVMLAFLVGCGNTSKNSASDNAASQVQESPGFSAEEEGLYLNDAGSAAAAPDQLYGQKIVYSSTFYIETLKFDDSYRAIVLALSEAGGHVSYSNQYGGQTSDGFYNARQAYLELKVPVDSYESFLNQTGSFGTVTNRSDSAQDITSSYIDVEARLGALRLQEERLLVLLEQAKDIETLLTIESRLSEVRYEIELYTSQKNTYDNMVAFCTVSIDLVEVSTLTVRTKGFWQELGDAVVGSLQSILVFLRGLVIALVYILPYALIAACVYFFLVRPLVKRSKAKRDALLAQQRTQMQINNGFPETSASPYTSFSLGNAEQNENQAKPKK